MIFLDIWKLLVFVDNVDYFNYILLRWKLLVDEDDKPRYVNGKRKGLNFFFCSFRKLKQRAFKVTRINLLECDLK